MKNNIDSQPSSCKATIDLLLTRWLILHQYAALEKLHSRQTDQQGTGVFGDFNFKHGKPIMQIEIIKMKILELLPEASPILPEFQDETNLAEEDYLEIYLEHQKISIGKIRELLERLEIT